MIRYRTSRCRTRHALGAQPKVGVEQVSVAPRNAHSVEIGYEFEHVHVLGHDHDVSERAPRSTRFSVTEESRYRSEHLGLPRPVEGLPPRPRR